jgi:hypothetical protein
MASRMRAAVGLSAGLLTAVSLHAAQPSGKRGFVNAWAGRTVVVKRALFSVVYDERSRVLPFIKHQDRVTGLTVVTPSGAAYYLFEAKRETEEDIVASDPNEIVSQMRKQYYRSMHIDAGIVQDIEPLMIVQYSPGVELIVRKVQIDRDRVRLHLHKEGKSDLATAITVKWPVPLSGDFTESPLIDAALGLYVTRQ